MGGAAELAPRAGLEPATKLYDDPWGIPRTRTISSLWPVRASGLQCSPSSGLFPSRCSCTQGKGFKTCVQAAAMHQQFGEGEVVLLHQEDAPRSEGMVEPATQA